MEKSYLGTNTICQLGLIVRDVRETGKMFAAFLGMELPEVAGSGDSEIVQAVYQGNPSDASCEMMFFETGSLQIELIQPDEKPSVWRDFLDEHGEGIHHIAFQVTDTEGKIRTLESKGMPMLQKGNYGNGSGMYAYFDATKQLKLFLETLESFPQPEE